jgi:hypothetical protein
MRISSATVAIATCAVVCAACDGGGAGTLGVAGAPTGPSSVESVRLTAEPGTLRAEVVPRADCRTLPPFRTHLTVSLRSGAIVFVRGIGFEFVDASGARRVPDVIPGSSAAASIPRSIPTPLPSSPPVPMPTSPPLPLPGTPAAFPGAAVEANAEARFPFTLDFPCGVPSSGTLFIAVQTDRGEGAGELLRASVRVRG